MSLGGFPVVYGIKPHKTSVDALHQLGTIGVTPDGRQFRYAQDDGTGLAAGKLCVAPDITTLHEDRPVNTFLAGDRSLTVTLGATAITGNEYQGGFVNIIDETGEGHIYGIADCPATVSGGTVVVRLKDAVAVGADDDTTVTLIRNPYRDVVISNTDQTDLPVGVTCAVFAADEYGWLQTKGIASCVVDTNTTTAGTPITIGASDNGAVEARDGVAEPIVGIQPAGAVADADEHGACFLTLD